MSTRRDLYTFATTCVSARGSDIRKMTGSAYEITRRSFIKWAGRENAAPAGDWGVRYYRSRYLGLPCVFMDHSAIEHVYTKGLV